MTVKQESRLTVRVKGRKAVMEGIGNQLDR